VGSQTSPAPSLPIFCPFPSAEEGTKGRSPLPYSSRMPPKGAAPTQSPVFLPVPHTPHPRRTLAPSQRRSHAGGPALAPAPKDCPFSSPCALLTAPGVTPGVPPPHPKRCPKAQGHTVTFSPRSLPRLEPAIPTRSLGLQHPPPKKPPKKLLQV